ncbi:dTDP-4-dehydrorhamnose 3,5-epimerase [Microbacteriaceae bacterium K1510]|nr:dTDP-4-dehydrorhamnose 3,5-epimerase [Microbacteriaceae bacterium K1510]
MALQVQSLGIPDVKIIRPRKHGDARGFFSETYNKKAFAGIGIERDFVQDNHSLSPQVGTLRGLHFQGPPFAQDKLVRVVSGRILDVAVDLRRNSPTFGQWVAAEISADAWNQIFVPIGFAHGICTLEPDTQLIYKVTNYYSPQHDFGIRWDDPDLAIAWPLSPNDILLSDKDRRQPLLRDAARIF